MKTQDTIRSAGHVEPYLLDVKTGNRFEIGGRHNTLSFDATHAMALAFGGDESLIPNRIGIIYGRDQNTQFSNIGRDQPWVDLKNELAELHADIQVQAFCYSPSFTQITRERTGYSSSESYPDISSSSEEPASYPGWGVTFHSHSDSVTPGVLADDSGSASAGSNNIFTTGAYMFQAVLLNLSRDTYTVIARTSLDVKGKYYQKPDNFEIAIDWTIKFF